ncbi:hypothetical protein ACO22_05255 [Paracoccidioides brasiliensis]|uniref:Uncharacterized protein n=1 Tax=Paracoccidioides brasiliensis TaxID=121759 RepID=A0A1D2JAT0_PARBR|nr:hypothetical protein ACO22_05255 [Paracoccidioides brasiliensis]
MASYGPTSARRMRVVFENDSTIRKNTRLFRFPESLEARVFSECDKYWILMSRMPGISLDKAWSGMSEDARRRVITPKILAGLGHARGTAAYDHRLKNGTPCGPFDSVSQFLDFLVEPMSRSPKPSLAKTYRAKFSDVYGVNFAHADL